MDKELLKLKAKQFALFLVRHYLLVINAILVTYVLVYPDRMGTWLGRFLLNVKMILGEI